MLCMTETELRLRRDPLAAAQDAADLFLAIGRDAIAQRGRFVVALAGGSTPRLTYKELASRRNELDWSRVIVLFGDERSVPPDHPDSNYKLAADTLLAHVPIPGSQVLRIIGEMPDHAHAAQLYEAALRRLFPGQAWPEIDLVLLGMGADGHTASLFPGTTALDETSRWAVATWVERLSTWRITLTFPVFAHARKVLFTITGQDKHPQITRLLQESRGADDLPAARVRNSSSGVIVIVDQAAFDGGQL
jgi:6-phosphogluconolactonase